MTMEERRTTNVSKLSPSSIESGMERPERARTPAELLRLKEDVKRGHRQSRTRTYSHLSELSVEFSLTGSVLEVDTLPESIDPPDGGYGWLIVLATCFGNFVFCFNKVGYGLFIPELTDYFSRSQTDMALVASVESIVRCISCTYRSTKSDFWSRTNDDGS